MDPSLETDLYADKPWALSPAAATMNHLSLRGAKAAAEEAESLSADAAAAPGQRPATIEEDALGYVGETLPGFKDLVHDVAARRKWFGVAANREALDLKEVEVGTEFSNGVLGERPSV